LESLFISFISELYPSNSKSFQRICQQNKWSTHKYIRINLAHFEIVATQVWNSEVNVWQLLFRICTKKKISR
jgi:hypothetical protein